MEQLERILAYPLFQHSKRYSSLLRYIVERSLERQFDCLHARVIAVKVFGRPPDFDTSEDSSVRVAAAEVRRRLFLYYKENEHNHELRIELPTRSYIAEFSMPVIGQQKHHAPLLPLSLRLPSLVAIALALFVTACLSAALWVGYHSWRPVAAIDKFWDPLISHPGTAFVMVGSPPPKEMPPEEAQAMPNSQLHLHADFSFADLSAANSITSFLGQHGKEASLRFAQIATLAEMKGQPLVLIGSLRNEWSMRFGATLRFQFKIDKTTREIWIEDMNNPANRMWMMDLKMPDETNTVDYALVTRAFDQSTGQWWIGIAGLTGISTLAAQQNLLDPKFLENLNNNLPKGWENKNLQVILAVHVVNNSPGTSQIISTHSW